MSEIEWQETSLLQPEQRSLADFCLQHGLPEKTAQQVDSTLAFIEEQALDALHDFLGHDTGREHGGILAGRPYFDPQQRCYFSVVHAAIPARETEGSPVHLQFTPQSWDWISGILEESFPDLVVVGWYHSHPGLGVFMSSTDQATQQAFFNHPWNLSVVVDPLAKHSGWFAGETCQPLNNQQVLPYRRVLPGQLEVKQRPPQPVRQAWGWLLPFFLISTAGLATYQWLKSRRKVNSHV
jgi:proteasome lid subunit RPN8/RPN11